MVGSAAHQKLLVMLAPAVCFGARLLASLEALGEIQNVFVARAFVVLEVNGEPRARRGLYATRAAIALLSWRLGRSNRYGRFGSTS